MSGEINESRDIITRANTQLTETSLQLNKPREKCKEALGILVTVLGIIREIRSTNEDIAETLQETFADATSAKEHIDNSLTAQSILGINQPASPGHEMFTTSSTALEAVTTLQEDIAAGINIAQTRDANRFAFASTALLSIKPPIETVLLQLDEVEKRNTEAIGLANAYIEKI